ncbi:MAG: hypothetical protein ABJP63_15895 [Hyphomicrobiales bacterium]
MAKGIRTRLSARMDPATRTTLIGMVIPMYAVTLREHIFVIGAARYLDRLVRLSHR